MAASLCRSVGGRAFHISKRLLASQTLNYPAIHAKNTSINRDQWIKNGTHSLIRIDKMKWNLIFY